MTADSAGNLPAMPAVFPDWEAPVIRKHQSGRELVKMRWGLPNPPEYGGINANIRNVKSPHWRRWMKPENRCLVPFNSFSEYNDKPNPASLKNPDGSKHPMAGKKDVVWFALNEQRPLCAFAGVWTEWSGARGTKANPIEGDHLIFAFLTCKANGVVSPVHEKAMPVILTSDQEYERWMNAPIDEIEDIQMPLADDRLMIVKRGAAKEDPMLTADCVAQGRHLKSN